MTVNLSTALTILVLVLLVIDLIYRVKHPAPKAEASKKDSALHEFFRDYKDQLSFTRLAIAVLLFFGFVIVLIGLIWPHLWDKCATVWEAILSGAKTLFTIGKAPEAVAQLQGIIGENKTNG